MITKEVIRALRHAHKTSISVNEELTKERLYADYNGSTYTQRNDAVLLGDTSEGSYKTAFRTGRLSIKPLAALAFTLQVSPYWYSGEAEEKEPYTDELMWNFFCDHDFLYLVRSFKPASVQDPELPGKMQELAMQELDPHKALQLLEALYIRAPHSKKATEDLTRILRILTWAD